MPGERTQIGEGQCTVWATNSYHRTYGFVPRPFRAAGVLGRQGELGIELQAIHPVWKIVIAHSRVGRRHQLADRAEELKDAASLSAPSSPSAASLISAASPTSAASLSAPSSASAASLRAASSSVLPSFALSTVSEIVDVPLK